MASLAALAGAVGAVAASTIPDNTLYPLPDRGPAVRDLRPRRLGRVIAQYHVKADGAGDYTSIAAATTAAAALQTSRRTAEGSTILTPRYVVEVIVHPGTYVQADPLELRPFVPVVAATSTPGAVVISSGSMGGSRLGTLNSTSDYYIEGVDVVRGGADPATNGKYCHHIALASHQTGVAVACRFYTDTINTGGGWTCAGMDGSPGATVAYYACEFWSRQAGTYAPGGTNLHGPTGGAPSGSIPADTIFAGCTAGAVGYNALGNLAADDVWVDGGTYTSVTASGLLTDLHHAGATGAMTAQGAVIANLDGMPVVRGGMSPRQRLRLFGTPTP